MMTLKRNMIDIRTLMALGCAISTGALMVLSNSAQAKPPKRGSGGDNGAAVKAKVAELVAKFESAYQHKDKVTMIKTLMTPDPDDLMVEKRYQWLRGFGPKDLPGSKHPPILFERPRGTFVPTAYTLKSVAPSDSTHAVATVTEKGTYTDEDGKYRVERERKIKCKRENNKWYIEDYPAPNDDDLGFGVDDIADKMKKI